MQFDPVGGHGNPVPVRAARTPLSGHAPTVTGAVGIGGTGWPAGLADAVAAAVRLAGRGETAAARALLRELWDGPGGAEQQGPLGRCLLAHHLAAVADDTDEELRWHMRALQGGQLASDAECAQWGLPIPVRALFPLLHLRLAQCHAARGEFPQARVHQREGWKWAPALPHDGYGTRVRAGLDRLGERLDVAVPPPGRHRA